ncbi:MAG: hypothetical protein ACK4NA_09275 [Alphaproteobacteria bacterium]
MRTYDIPHSTANDATDASRLSSWHGAALLTALAWAAYAMHWPLLDLVIPWDAKDYYYPVLRALADARAAGDSGFWNPYLFAGHDAAADPQSWLFSPGFRLIAELSATPGMLLVDQAQLAHLLAGGLGALLLARALGWAPSAGLLAALVFMFGGVASSRLQHSLMTVSYAYLPWALWLLHRALHDERARARWLAAAGFGLAAGLMALDRDQTAFLNCWLLIGASLWWLRGRWRRAPALALAAVVGALIVAAPVLLTLDALGRSTRPEIGFELAAYASQQPASLLTLLAPNFFGNLDAAYWGPGRLPWMEIAPLGNDWTDETTNYLYIGALPLALLLAGFVRRGPWPAGSGLFAAGALFALLYALGVFTPAFRLFYDWLPGVDLYRRPNDAAFPLNAMLALLVGAAAQRWLERPAGGSLVRLILAIALLGSALAAALWLAERFGQMPGALAPLVWGLGALLAALAFLRSVGTARRIALSLICVVAAADLIFHNAAAPFNAQPRDALAAYQPTGERLAATIQARLQGPDGPYRAEIYGLGGDWQNAPLVYGIEQTLGYSPLRRADYAAATGAYQNNHGPERRLTDDFTGYDSPLARLLGIRLVAVGRPIEDILPPEARQSLRLVETADGAWLYENAAALPRVMVVGRAEPEAGQALPADPAGRVLIAGLSAPIGDAGPAGDAWILSRSRDAWRIAARLERPGYLVINELFHPAWQATAVDGSALLILRANRLFRAIPLPAGEHELVLRFQPFAASNLARALRGLAGRPEPLLFD